MARIKKKGTSGQAKNFVTRTQALRKLQVSLPDFRRLCIYKGIYPREPRNKRKASKSASATTTFYYAKDIQYLLHEPLLQKFRDHKALSKKIARALGKDELGDAVRLEKSGVGRLTLDHVIKERYPTFVDALRDLDDALSMLFLFAHLPANTTAPAKTIALCQRLCHEFQHYIITAHALRKSFISIKGIYYQATIQGQDIMWLVPHRFVQQVTNDVDFRIMGTFVDFYTTLLGFVNFRLYTSIGLIYPPKFDSSSDERSGELGAFKLEGVKFGTASKIQQSGEPALLEASLHHSQDIQTKVDAIAAEINDAAESQVAEQEDVPESTEVLDDFKPAAEGADVLPQPQLSSFEAGSLFAPFTFFLAREVPRQPLEFILRAFGCKRIGWDEVLGDGAFTNDESNPSITHQVVDRPPITAVHYDVSEETTPATTTRLPPGHRVPGRIYIQPQWVWDCLNGGKLLRSDLYAPGATLPPHLSPWVKPRKGAYDPSLPLEEQEMEGEAEEFAEEAAEADALAAAAEESPAALMAATQHQRKALEGDASESEEEADGDATFANFDEGDEDEDDDVEKEPQDTGAIFRAVGAHDGAEIDLHQAELEAEAAGMPFSAKASSNGAVGLDGTKSAISTEARKKASRRQQEERDELQRRLGMMSRKKRLAAEKMLAEQGKDDAEAKALRKKRRRLEKDGNVTPRV